MCLKQNIFGKFPRISNMHIVDSIGCHITLDKYSLILIHRWHTIDHLLKDRNINIFFMKFTNLFLLSINVIKT